MGVNVAAHTRHLFLGSAHPGSLLCFFGRYVRRGHTYQKNIINRKKHCLLAAAAILLFIGKIIIT